MSEQTEQQTTPSEYLGTGRRKTSVARVRLKPNGSGKITVHKKPFEEHFQRQQDRNMAMRAMHVTGALSKFDLAISVSGGGIAGQAGAVLLGVARALSKADNAYFEILRDSGMLTRDARMVERKKPGQKGARASFQFSKR